MNNIIEQFGFIPFGSQYFRYPTPFEDCWENDIKNISAYGFNTIKIWAQWRSNCPLEGIYDFSDLEKLMNISLRYGIKVIINIILDVAPVWFYKKYPESLMICADGTVVHPRAIGCRQIGGTPGPCYHHEAAIQAKKNFVRALAEKFASHPALLLWDLWNEPELTTAIYREPSMDKMVCYCKSTEDKFISWLEQKYGRITALNSAWQRCYQSFGDIELPRTANTYKDMVDFRAFMAQSLVCDLADRVQSVKEFDQTHPVMVHTVPPPYFNMINACCDDEKMAELCDLFGNSIGSYPMPAALSVSSAGGRDVINAEIHAVGGATFFRPGLSSYETFKKHIFTPFARGIKGFVFWQYRPETTGNESPAWGLTDMHGGHTEYLDWSVRINDILRNNLDITLTAKPAHSEIAIIKEPSSEVFTWCADFTVDKYNRSIEGAFDIFHRLGHNSDLLTHRQLLINESVLSHYKVIYAPFPYYMDGKTADVLENWVANGGTLISEAFFGAYRDDDNLHSKTVPGFGFDKLFGCREKRAITSQTFAAAYGDEWWTAQGKGAIDANLVTIKLNDNSFIRGSFFCENFDSLGGEPIGYYEDGGIAAVTNSYENGKAYIIGSLIAAGYHITRSEGNIEFIRSILAASGVSARCDTGSYDIRADVLTNKNGAVVIVNSSCGLDGRITVCVKDLPKGARLVDLETGAECSFEHDRVLSFGIDIKPYSVRVFGYYFV